MSTKSLLQGRVRSACENHLKEFVSSTSGIMLAQLTTADGFEVATHLGQSRAETSVKLAAMSSSLWALCAALTSESHVGVCRNVILEGGAGQIVVMEVPNSKPSLSLLVVADNSAVLGQLLWASRRATCEFSRLIVS